MRFHPSRSGLVVCTIRYKIMKGAVSSKSNSQIPIDFIPNNIEYVLCFTIHHSCNPLLHKNLQMIESSSVHKIQHIQVMCQV